MNTPETRAEAKKIAKAWQEKLEAQIAKIMSDARVRIADEKRGCRASMIAEILALGIDAEDLKVYPLDGGKAECRLPAMSINIFAPEMAADPEEPYTRQLWIEDQV